MIVAGSACTGTSISGSEDSSVKSRGKFTHVQPAMPTGLEVKHLFRAFLREGRRFPNYNIREYVKRKARDAFAASAPIDIAGQQALLQRAKQELEAVKRQAVVYALYARKQRSVMDVPLVKVLEKQAAAATTGKVT